MREAIIVVDMLNDFVTGALACDRGKAIVPHLAKFLDEARKVGVPVIFANDCHSPGIDREFKVWGPHAIEGTKGAEVIPELKLNKEIDYVVPKKRYSGFFQTGMDALLRELGVDTVIITGLHAHMCCRHTAADAFQLGYEVEVASDCTDAFTLEDYNIGIKYLKEVYGAKVMTSDEFIACWNK